MVREEDVRAVALSLPETAEKSHMGHADFRVRDRVFAGFPNPGELSLRLDAAEQAAVVATAPQSFRPAAGAWGRQGWTIVTLATAEQQELRELVIEAWRGRAPKRLVTAYDAG
ncbi:MmcQ/YjbR family DNA-binding protein [Conexibacter woesei]|uniref:MmcQ/YjbR family DNA-binding protein n=1 Tax=Conexibacter woesei (strain DSM 14684 / CCUG 47730 / CIP 108061 / JCM 11494 / NBRC 100937 / ID131577) TaxID=469383 RepID=D3F4I7_CONWI|nr:MmcQ/YjbR family DNA-binding protein [Conexibacter woesei]ADB52444.1 conserved hypothetical protein [Conexibacter woesei DSM 14684]